MSTVDYSPREAAEHPEGNPWFRAVYAAGEPVGYVMLSWDVEPQPDLNGPWFRWKLIVDHRHQGRGYGRDIVRQVVDLVREEGATELLTSHVPGEGGPAESSTRSSGSCPGVTWTRRARSSSGSPCSTERYAPGGPSPSR